MHSNGSLVFRMNYVASERSPSGKIFALLIHNPITRHTRHAGTHTHTSHTYTRTHTHIHLYIHTHTHLHPHIYTYTHAHTDSYAHTRAPHTHGHTDLTASGPSGLPVRLMFSAFTPHMMINDHTPSYKEPYIDKSMIYQCSPICLSLSISVCLSLSLTVSLCLSHTLSLTLSLSLPLIPSLLKQRPPRQGRQGVAKQLFLGESQPLDLSHSKSSLPITRLPNLIALFIPHTNHHSHLLYGFQFHSLNT